MSTTNNIYLLYCKHLLVESLPNDLYWGSGLNYHLTQTTHPDYYPGLNKLGKLLCELRVLLREKISSSSLPAEAMDEVTTPLWLQTTQPTSGGAVTVVSSCCTNCVEPPRPQQWGPDLPFFGHAGHADPLDGWRCCSQKRVMSRPIQVRQL